MSAACLEAVLEESRRAAYRGPPLLRLFKAILLSARLAALLAVAVGVVLRSVRAWGQPWGSQMQWAVIKPTERWAENQVLINYKRK